MSKNLMMWLLCFSLAFNVAFVGVWVHRRLETGTAAGPPEGDEIVLNEPQSYPSPFAGLELSPDQESRIEGARREMADKMQDVLDETASLRDRVFELMQSPKPDREAIRAAVREIGENEKKMRELAIDHWLHTSTQLTPEQRQQWAGKLRRIAYRRFGRHRRSRDGNARATVGRTRSDRDGRDTRQDRQFSPLSALGAPNVEIVHRPLGNGMEFVVRAADRDTVEELQRQLGTYFDEVRRGRHTKAREADRDVTQDRTEKQGGGRRDGAHRRGEKEEQE